MSKRRIGGPPPRPRRRASKRRTSTAGSSASARYSDPIPESADFFALSEQYPDDRSAETYFTDKRWPDGPRCTECGSANVYDGKSKRKHTQWKCRPCGKQFTVIGKKKAATVQAAPSPSEAVRAKNDTTGEGESKNPKREE